MKDNNPMKNPVTRAKVSTKLRAMRHQPKLRGGNGHLTLHQQLLATALGWDMEIAVKTLKKPPLYAHHYKIDIGNVDLKIAIEIDGTSHHSLVVKRERLEKRGIY